jgi:hypothetical protein
MDGYARAAEDFCRVVEGFDSARFVAERASSNPSTVSPHAICVHACGAAHRYAHYIRKARGVDFVERYELDPSRLVSPQEVRSNVGRIFMGFLHSTAKRVSVRVST